MKKSTAIKTNKFLVGQNEWCAFPDLKIPAIRARVDTGAKTSALHAFNVKPCVKKGKPYVSFEIHPLQRNNTVIINCCAPVVDERNIMSSNGQKEKRYIISSTLEIAETQWEIEISLTNRDPLQYRFLLGRQALSGHVIVDPSLTYHQKKISPKALTTLYSATPEKA